MPAHLPRFKIELLWKESAVTYQPSKSSGVFQLSDSGRTRDNLLMNPRKKMENKVAELEGYIAQTREAATEQRKKLKEINATKEEYWRVAEEEKAEVKMHYDEIVLERDAFWHPEARRHFIELPPITDETTWQMASSFGESLYLTDLAILKIHNEIRKKRRENWTFAAGLFGSIGGVLIGLLGLVVAVLTLMHGK